ncbi:molybdopterin-binding protein [Desulfobaculum bizertense]|uniref:Molybdopterin molybdenumtransferase n=1 Tax=Desulfobaculum bizertense DSM 18034 TaxID=1121442 RepID=A0A1T4VPH2_9BACT|nr:molybdopterin-binding protein [Desulfobaculum bizertense]UIJ38202.1 molybdopterin-binding protein [Desulfobaculum bizertense]SKA66795.1 molybdenum cofactor synthesis domain-containing protein [Desulfobaculum bizertense DSM 18034]
MMKAIPVQESIGSVLCQDMTRIVPGECKGPAFRKGHIIKEEDIPTLLDIGKEHVYVLTLEDGQLHENEAADRIAKAAAGPGITLSDVSEGRINMTAEPGLLTINVEALKRINSIQDVVLATMHDGLQISKARDVAGTRVVPLVVEEEKIQQVEEICREAGPIVSVTPFRHLKIGVVTTGTEVLSGRIKDKFGPVIRKKFKALNSEVIGQTLVGDDPKVTSRAILDAIHDGAEMVVVTGGMSVDPDDQTPASIRATGAKVITYGSPTFPGVMFMYAELDGVPIVGLPGCVMYYRASIFDLVVPRIVAGQHPTREDIVDLCHGGFCAGCETCRFPLCSFGK